MQPHEDALALLLQTWTEGLDVSIENRGEGRTQTNIRASMRLINPACSEKIQIQILDFSRNGLKIECARYIAPGTTVQLRIKTSHIVGDVRYCIAIDFGFWCGIQIQDLQ